MSAPTFHIPLDQAQFAVFDVETTGLSHWREDRILEVAIVRIDSHGTVLDEFATLLNPEREFESGAIHGVTPEMVADAPTFAEVAGTIYDKLAGGFVAAHNAKFDVGFMEAEFRLLKVAFQPPAICTMLLRARAGLPGERMHKLSWACEEHGIELTEAHSALADAKASASLLADYLAELHSNGIRMLAHDRRPLLPGTVDLGRSDYVKQRPAVVADAAA